MKILVSFSGGKDSQACLIQAFKQYGGGNLTAVFCDTGWEHPDTYKHVNDVCLQMGVRLLMDFEESFARVNYWKSKSRRFLPHCQPFRDLNNPHQIIPQWQKDMAHWADRKEIYMSCDFKDFSPRKGFLCKEYFKIL